MKKGYNPLKFKTNFFSSMTKIRLTPCEYKCIMILLEGKEYTKSQLGQILGVSQQNIGRAMLRLEKLGIVIKTKIEGRNMFYTINLNFNIPNTETINKDQLLL